jgi:hypothetical protein
MKLTWAENQRQNKGEKEGGGGGKKGDKKIKQKKGKSNKTLSHKKAKRGISNIFKTKNIKIK